jgi:hypothetical protein
MPVLRVHDHRPGRPGRLDLSVRNVDDRLGVTHVEAAVRIREVVLHVDDE